MPIPLGVPGAQICIEIPGSTDLYWGVLGAQVCIGGPWEPRSILGGSWEHRSVLGGSWEHRFRIGEGLGSSW